MLNLYLRHTSGNLTFWVKPGKIWPLGAPQIWKVYISRRTHPISVNGGGPDLGPFLMPGLNSSNFPATQIEWMTVNGRYTVLHPTHQKWHLCYYDDANCITPRQYAILNYSLNGTESQGFMSIFFYLLFSSQQAKTRTLASLCTFFGGGFGSVNEKLTTRWRHNIDCLNLINGPTSILFQCYCNHCCTAPSSDMCSDMLVGLDGPSGGSGTRGLDPVCDCNCLQFWLSFGFVNIFVSFFDSSTTLSDFINVLFVHFTFNLFSCGTLSMFESLSV